MKIKLAAVLILSFFYTSAYAEQLQVGSVLTEQPEQVSFIVTLPPGLEVSPKASDFQLLDGASVLKSADLIEPFGKSDKELILLLCVDASGSMTKAILNETQNALIGLLTQIRPQDQLGLVSFANKLMVDLDFTSDRNALIKSIRKLKPRGKKTVLYQALVDSLNLLNKNKTVGYRRLLLISDGKDEESIDSIDSAIDLSKSYGIPIDVVGRGKIEPQLTKGLGALANATGGRFVYAGPDSTSLKDAIIRIYKNFIEDTWIVHFRYKPAIDKPYLKNAFIKFETSNNLSISAVISQGIPAPQAQSEPPVSEPIWKRIGDWLKTIDWKLLLPYLGLALMLMSLGLVLWFFLRHRHKPQPVKITPYEESIFGQAQQWPEPGCEPKAQPHQEVRPRQTVVGTVAKISPPGLELAKLVLTVLKGPLEGQKIPISKPLFRIGADPGNDLVLSGDAFISGNHALLRYDNGELLLSDQHSRNGTLLNGELVKDKALAVFPGDIIELGNSSLKILET